MIMSVESCRCRFFGLFERDKTGLDMTKQRGQYSVLSSKYKFRDQVGHRENVIQ